MYLPTYKNSHMIHTRDMHTHAGAHTHTHTIVLFESSPASWLPQRKLPMIDRLLWVLWKPEMGKKKYWSSNSNGWHEWLLLGVLCRFVYMVRATALFTVPSKPRVHVCARVHVCVCAVAVKRLFAILPVCSCNIVGYVLLYLTSVCENLPAAICYLLSMQRGGQRHLFFILHSKHFVCIFPVCDQTSVTS